jgi:hypothetical protein
VEWILDSTRPESTGNSEHEKDDRTMSARWLLRFAPVGVTTLALMASVAVAQSAQTPVLPASALVAQSPEFAAVRARFEDLTPADLAQDGYQIDAVCVGAAMIGAPPELGNMGYHAVHPTLMKVQFGSGRPDPEQPPIVLLDAVQRVVGLEWEANQNVSAPVLFGQTVVLQPGHPGGPQPHYMLHAYFRPQDQVLFSVFDPQLSCPLPGVARDATRFDSQPFDTRSLFSAVWGAAAAEQWALEHNSELTREGR